ncbi:MAG: AAA family ATPase, partial [Angustibacter sp.]
RQLLPDADLKLAVGSHRLILSRAAVAAARARARATGAPHNVARVTFVKDILRHLARQLAEQMRQELTADLREELDADLRDARDVRVNVNLLWMPLTPLKFLQDLLATEVRLASAARSLKPAERALLARSRDEPIRVADVPLLAELGELIGDDGEAARAAEADQLKERARERDYAESVLAMTGLSGSGVNADMLVDQFSGFGPALTVAERAAEDPEWTFGHLVVDEAQELSPMMWRFLARKCPNRSWTVVGDLAQRAAVDGAKTWAQVLDPVAAGRWQEHQLTVSYRTPGRVLALADAVATAGNLPLSPVRSVREGDFDPRIEAWPGRNLARLTAVVRDLVAQAEQGTVAVVAPESAHAAVAETLATELPGLVGAAADSALSVRVSVLKPDQVKGLEFDDVVVLEPGEIVAAGRRGLSDLYVALSRPTRQLVVLHSGPLPAGLG